MNALFQLRREIDSRTMEVPLEQWFVFRSRHPYNWFKLLSLHRVGICFPLYQPPFTGFSLIPKQMVC